MEKREYGTNPMAECRHDANEKVDKAKRRMQILKVLNRRKKGMTAKEISVYLCNAGLIPTSERNFVSPRLTELCDKGKVEPIGKKTCEYTGRKVTVYRVIV